MSTLTPPGCPVVWMLGVLWNSSAVSVSPWTASVAPWMTVTAAETFWTLAGCRVAVTTMSAICPEASIVPAAGAGAAGAGAAGASAWAIDGWNAALASINATNSMLERMSSLQN